MTIRTFKKIFREMFFAVFPSPFKYEVRNCGSNRNLIVSVLLYKIRVRRRCRPKLLESVTQSSLPIGSPDIAPSYTSTYEQDRLNFKLFQNALDSASDSGASSRLDGGASVACEAPCCIFDSGMIYPKRVRASPSRCGARLVISIPCLAEQA